MDRTAILAAIENAWNARPGKMDWLKLEVVIRSTLALAATRDLSESEALTMIAEAVSAFTRRGAVPGYPA